MATSSLALSQQQENGKVVNVVYAWKQDAKNLKSALENAGMLDKNFRMARSESDPGVIAFPVVEDIDQDTGLEGLIIGKGSQICPYSTRVMGKRMSSTAHCPATNKYSHQVLPVQRAVLLTVDNYCSINREESCRPSDHEILGCLGHLDRTIVPEKLEVFGDDRVVVIPPHAFEEHGFGSMLRSWIDAEPKCEDVDPLMEEFWKHLAAVHGSTRVVRRGKIDANSRVRQSGHRLLFPQKGVPDITGPGTPGWIRVTEQGIRQSFDMTRVMFSRGNISEKIRFGKLVRHGEVVLDMYAGIGYYTLPALIHGKARHVVACEWNGFALQALRYNLEDNGVAESATVLEGDSRDRAAEHGFQGVFDRVSLGLLPSSQGGWKTSILALKPESGGWLHIHGNVRDAEKDRWTLWVCSRLLSICQEDERRLDWIVLCDHVENVKSFAPTVSHLVADIFVGAAHLHPRSSELGEYKAGVLDRTSCRRCNGPVPTPSCDLSPEGTLSQSWMM